MRQLTLEVIAIRAILEVPDTDDRQDASAVSDEFACQLLAALRPRPLASTRPSNVVPMRKVGSR